MKVVFTAMAERGLIAIADYVAQDNPARALRFVRLLRDKALSGTLIGVSFLKRLGAYSAEGDRLRLER